MEPFNVHGGNANAKQRHAYPTKYARCLDGTGGWAPSQGGTLVAAFGGNDTTGARDVATALNVKGGTGRADFEIETFVAHTLRGTGHDASEDGTGRGVPLVPVEHWRQTCECGTEFTGPMNMPCPGCGEIRGGWTHGDPIVFNNRGREGGAQVEVDPTGLVNLRAAGGGSSRSMVAYQCHGSNVGEMGTLRKGSGSVAGGVPFVAVEPVAFTMKDHGADAGDISPTLRSGGHAKSHANGGVYPAVAFDTYNQTVGNVAHTLRRGGGAGGDATPATLSPYGVRRLTPREMERLQGFPDDYTAIPWRGKDAKDCPDGPRAKALGNSMAVPVMRWIGRRIALVDGER